MSDNTERLINYENPEVAWISSEPGDGTVYSYGLIKVPKQHMFAIIPWKSTFKFPRVLSERLAVQLHAETFNMTHKARADYLIKQASELDCNPYTLAEVIMGIASLSD